MKHLKKISELYKSTYLDAARKLSKKHQQRADDIMDWAKEKGQSEFGKVNVDRIYPHAFVFSNNKEIKDRWFNKLFLGKFYITDAKEATRRTHWGIEVSFMNDWGQTCTIDFTFAYEGGDFQLWLNFPSSDHMMLFLFDNRKDARHFLRFTQEWIDDNTDIDFSEFKCSINDFYYTDPRTS